MNIGFDLIATNVAVTFENIVLLIVMLGGIILYAKDVRIGIITQFVLSSALFMWFFAAGYNYVYAEVCMFITFILMCFSLYAVSKTTTRGGLL